MPLFAFPLAIAAVAALPTLAAIYWLHNRFQRRVVSSLFLWADHSAARAGGVRWQRIHTPLLFFLEVLTLLMLVIAAMGPRVVAPGRTPPLMVVLDDSFSMQAGGVGAGGTRSLAIDALKNELSSEDARNATLILAGAKPQLLGRLGERGANLTELLPGWMCQSPRADLDSAMSLAGELSNGQCRILVITDRAPPKEVAKGRVRWRAFGSARANVAIVNAARTRTDDVDRLLLEVANYSTLSRRVDLTIEMAGTPERQTAPQTTHATADLPPRETRRVTLDLPDSCGVVTVHLDEDALALDNRVTLLPPIRRSARVAIDVSDPALAPLLKNTLAAIPEAAATPTGSSPQLLISDKPPTATADAQTWHTQLIVDADAQAYVGPFVIDYAHPMTKGLGLDTIVWGAGQDLKLPGTVVIAAGNVPLLTDDARFTGRHDLRLRFAPKVSTLQATPNWPILLWNLVHWRAMEVPGIADANVRVGESALVRVPADVQRVTVRDPKGTPSEWAVSGLRLTIPADQPGVFEVQPLAVAGGTTPAASQFAANLFNADESDLAVAETGQWGTWMDEASLWWEYRGIAWVFLLVALAGLSAHGFLVARAGRVGT